MKREYVHGSQGKKMVLQKELSVSMKRKCVAVKSKCNSSHIEKQFSEQGEAETGIINMLPS